MKKTLFLLFFASLLICNSCIHDFEEGADISFRSVTARLTDIEWLVQGIWINGIDSTGYEPYKSLIGDLKYNFSRIPVSSGIYLLKVNVRSKNILLIGDWSINGTNLSAGVDTTGRATLKT
jgi:hypothetical protein